MATEVKQDALRVDSGGDADLERFGYAQRLDRTIGTFTSFCVSFSVVSVTTATFTLFGDPRGRLAVGVQAKLRGCRKRRLRETRFPKLAHQERLIRKHRAVRSCACPT